MKNFFVILLITIVLPSCATRAPETSKKEPAVSAAIKEAERLFGWKKVIVDYAELSNGIWSVMLSKSPEAPGGFIVFKVSSEGKILQWKGGS